jgi:putative addiction module component (TIGR02574 family)
MRARQSGKIGIMTKLLEDAIAQARKLPETEQDALAETVFAYIANSDVRYQLTDDQVEEVKRRQQALREGKSRFATDEEVAALWKKCGL